MLDRYGYLHVAGLKRDPTRFVLDTAPPLYIGTSHCVSCILLNCSVFTFYVVGRSRPSPRLSLLLGLYVGRLRFAEGIGRSQSRIKANYPPCQHRCKQHAPQVVTCHAPQAFNLFIVLLSMLLTIHSLQLRLAAM
jgi:hypothetical protein